MCSVFSFSKSKSSKATDQDRGSTRHLDFSYLDPKAHYFDTACQSLRPQPAIDAQDDYYHHFNSCGHRVKYPWGVKTDDKVQECRQSLLKLAGKSSADYTVAFCLNTTAGINLVLQQLPKKIGDQPEFRQIVTSDIEHNSVFLPTMVWASRQNLLRKVLSRASDGSLPYSSSDIDSSVVVLNSMSNIDGRELLNAKQLASDIHKTGGLLLLDACQSFGHHPELLSEIDFDAAFGSGHKMYGPSVGFIIIKKKLLRQLDCFLIGGSTVQDVSLDDYTLVENDDELYARIEPGLQNYAGIVGLNEAIRWRAAFRSPVGENAQQYEQKLSTRLAEIVVEFPQFKHLAAENSPIINLYSDKIDGHTLGQYISQAGIMCRTGYHCCHYYLKEVLKLPPLLRISIGLHNTQDDLDVLRKTLAKVVQSL